MELYILKLKTALSLLKTFLDLDCYPDHRQNLISSPSSHFQYFLKTPSKSVLKDLNYVANKQTHKQTNKLRQKHNLLGGGN